MCLSELVNKKTFSDVEIIVDGLSFYGHKAILAQRSSFFRSIFVEGRMPQTVRESLKYEGNFIWCLSYRYNM
jgi:hypothetical protein